MVENEEARAPARGFAVLSALGCGAAAVLLADVVLFGAPSPPPLGDPAVWVADRDGDRVVVLDRDLFVLHSIAVRAPIAVAPVDDGAWVLSVPARHARASRALEFIAADGSRTSVVELDARFTVLAALGADLVVAGSDDGRVRWIAASACRVVHELRLDGSIRDLVPAARPSVGPARTGAGTAPTGAVWILSKAATSQLACFDAAGDRVAGPFDAHEAHGVAAPSSESVWTYEPARVRQLDARGRVVRAVALADSPAAIEAAAGARSGAWFVATAGSLIALDAHGRLAAGQGGFDYLVDVAVR